MRRPEGSALSRVCRDAMRGLRRFGRSARRNRGEQQVGASAVEMALLLPILVILAYGVIQFGIIFAQDLGMGNGAREGARFAATDSTLACKNGSTGVIDRVIDTSATAFLDTSTINAAVYVGNYVDVTAAEASTPLCTSAGGNVTAPPCKNSSAGDRVFVVTSAPAELAIPFGPVDPSFEVNGVGVFVCEYQ